MQDDISGWNEWEAAFGDIAELAGPSELHGLVMGMLCVMQPPDAGQWQVILSQLQVSALPGPALQLLVDEAQDAAAALADDSLDYMPLLPDDQHVLHERIQALADWCNGVVLGFGLASGQLRSGEAELLQDLQAVAAVALEDAEYDEAGEVSYTDLLEFVRLIPVSLAMGRKKQAASDMPILKHAVPRKENQSGQPMPADHAQAEPGLMVEMCSPHRPC